MPPQRSAPPDRFVIVFNPVAGKRRAARLAEQLSIGIRGAGRPCETVATTPAVNAEDVAIDCLNDGVVAERLCIVACGGDGTVQQVANAVAAAESDSVVMGVAPSGRCNDFARALHVDSSPDRILETLLAGRTRSVDLGRIGRRYFCTIAAVGFDAAVSRFVNDMRFPLSGTAAYVYGTLRMLTRYRTPTLRVRGDDDEYAGPVFLVAAANTACYGGSMRIAPDADPTDGLLHVCLVTAIKRRRVLRLLPRVLSGDHVSLPEVRMLKTRRLEITPVSDGTPVEVWADGEAVAALPTAVESISQAIEVVAP